MVEVTSFPLLSPETSGVPGPFAQIVTRIWEVRMVQYHVNTLRNLERASPSASVSSPVK